MAKKNTILSDFLGKFQQDENFGIRVTTKENTERVKPITYDAKHCLTRKATASELHQLRSVTQSLAWIARQTHPDLSYRLSVRTFENARVRDLRECNRIMECAMPTSKRGIYFSAVFSWDDAVGATIIDSSFCQEQEQGDGITRDFKSQQACITALAPANALNAERDAYSHFELQFDENQKSLSQYFDGRRLCTVQRC